MLALNFFFLFPIGTFSIADPQNWVALFAFLAVSLVASHLSAQARDRADEALGRRDELARLFDLSRDVCSITDSRDALTSLARAIDRRFDLEFVAVALPRGTGWEMFEAGTSMSVPRRELDNAFASAQASPTLGPVERSEQRDVILLAHRADEGHSAARSSMTLPRSPVPALPPGADPPAG